MNSNTDKCKIVQETPNVTLKITGSEWEFGVMVSPWICQYNIDQEVLRITRREVEKKKKKKKGEHNNARLYIHT